MFVKNFVMKIYDECTITFFDIERKKFECRMNITYDNIRLIRLFFREKIDFVQIKRKRSLSRVLTDTSDGSNFGSN